MTSIQKFQIVASPNAAIAALNQIRNIGYYNSKLWWAARSGTALYVQTAPSITGSTTNEHTYTGAGPMSMTSVTSICCRNYGQKIYAGMIGQSTFITSYYFGWRISYSTNGGAAWTDVELNDDLQASSMHSGVLLDFFFDGTIHWAVYVRAKTATAAVLTFYDLAGGTAYTQSMTTTDRERAFGGYYLAGSYYMMFHDGTNLKDCAFNCTTHAFTLTTSSLATPANFDAGAQQLWYQNGTYYMLNKRGFHIKAKTTSTWTSYGPLADASITVGVIWAHSGDDLIINYLIWNNRIYRLDIFNGGVGAIQDVDMGARVGYSDWYVDDDGDDVYQSNYYNANFMNPVANYQRRMVPFGSIMNINTVLFANQMLVVYKPSTTTIEYVGFVEYNPGRAKTDLQYRLINPLELDLYRPITYSCTSLTSVQIRTELFNSYCNFAKVGTLTGSGATYTIVNLNARIIDILNFLDYLEKFVWYPKPNCAINSDLGTTDTTIDVAAGTDLFARHHKSIVELEYGKVMVTGGYGTTPVVIDTQPEFGIAYFRFPLINLANQALLTTIATNLSEVINTALEIHQFTTSQKDLLQPGQQCTAVNTIGQALATGQWFIKSTQLHIDNRRQTVVLENRLQFDLQTENGYNAVVANQAIDEANIAHALAYMLLTDNQANAYEFREGANSYLKFVTTNGSEAVVLSKVCEGVTPTAAAHLTRKDYCDAKLPLAGGTMSGAINLSTQGWIKLEPAWTRCSQTITVDGYCHFADNDTDLGYFNGQLPLDFKAGGNVTLWFALYNNKTSGKTVKWSTVAWLNPIRQGAFNTALNNWNGEAGDTITITTTLNGSVNAQSEHFNVANNIAGASAGSMIHLQLKRNASGDDWTDNAFIQVYMTYDRAV